MKSTRRRFFGMLLAAPAAAVAAVAAVKTADMYHWNPRYTVRDWKWEARIHDIIDARGECFRVAACTETTTGFDDDGNPYPAQIQNFYIYDGESWKPDGFDVVEQPPMKMELPAKISFDGGKTWSDTWSDIG